MKRGLHAVVLALLVLSVSSFCAQADDITDADVQKAIDKGVNYVLRAQSPDGSWASKRYGKRPGVTAMTLLALVNCHVDKTSKSVRMAADYLSKCQLQYTYDVGLIAMALREVNPVKYRQKIKACSDWLIEAMNDGAWSYGNAGKPRKGQRKMVRRGDNSNTQYAVLGLRAAAESGVKIPKQVWEKIQNYFNTTQNEDGGWSYAGRGRSYGSMVAAGLASLFISGSKLHHTTFICGQIKEDPHLIKGIQWFAKNFSVKANPGGGGWHLYYLYGLERCGVMSGMRYFGAHDWYKEGAEFLVSTQQNDGTWNDMGRGGGGALTTSFGLLFLGKGKVPVLYNKLRYGIGWNNNPHDLENLCKEVGKTLKVQCSTQVVNLEGKVEDLLMAPALYFNGHDCRDFTVEEIKKLQKYIENGGFLFAEACCGKKAFDTKFRELAKKLLPDYSLEKLPADHAIYRSHYKIDPNVAQLWGIKTGCKRLSVLYSPKPLSYYWEGRPGNQFPYQLGINISAFVMQARPLMGKLEKVKLAKGDDDIEVEKIEPGAFVLQMLEHNGGSNPIPIAVKKWLVALREKVSMRVAVHPLQIRADDKAIFKYDFTYMAGHSKFKYGKTEIEGLRKYLTEGGFLFAEPCCGVEEFDKAFREMVKELFPKEKMEILPAEHPLISGKFGYDLRKVEYLPAVKKEAPELVAPHLEAIIINGRICLLYSKYGLGASIAKQTYPECKGYTPEDALKLAINIVVYSMGQ